MKHLFKFSLLLLALLLPATAMAYDFYANGIYYNINGNEVTVTYKGTSPSQYSDRYTGSVTIPSTVNYGGMTYSVTSIGGWAFYECSGLTSVTIPNSVTSIGESAFSGCSGLTNVIIPNSVTSIGGGAFYLCSGLTSIVVASGNPTYDSRGNCNAIIESATNTLILGCMNTVIPNSVTIIGEAAFAYCSGLISVTIPNSVTSIGGYAFAGCTGLTGIEIPNSVTTIGSYAFQGCSGLTSVTIGNSVTSIDYYAFNGCSGITDLIWNARNCSSMGIPASNIERVTVGDEVEILPNSFVSGSKISSVNIPNAVTSIGSGAFRNCSNLTSIKVETGNPKYDSRNNCNAIIMTATNALVVGCKNSIVPNSVISIGNSAFYDCTGLTSISIPNSVTSIGDYAFYGCSGLTSITIPNSVTSIGTLRSWIVVS